MRVPQPSPDLRLAQADIRALSEVESFRLSMKSGNGSICSGMSQLYFKLILLS